MRQFIDEDIMDDIVVISEATLEVLRGKAIDILNQLRKQSVMLIFLVAGVTLQRR